MPKRDSIVSFSDSFLSIDSFRDRSANGLQVIGRDDVKRISAGVSFSLELLERSIRSKSDMILVHHGLFWGDLGRIDNEILKAKIKGLFDSRISLCAYHLPLDAHLDIGNNISLLREIGLDLDKPFAPYDGKDIGVIGKNTKGISMKEAIGIFEARFSSKVLSFKNNEAFSKIGIVSGRGGASFMDAYREGCDTFITGEAQESLPALAKEAGMNLIFIGHYNSEKIGIWNLSKLIGKKFGVETEFIDIPNSI
jgi:dinuclear metal center YbgI/SA1388 family protein